MSIDMDDWVEENLTEVDLDNQFKQQSSDPLNILSDKSPNPAHWVDADAPTPES